MTRHHAVAGDPFLVHAEVGAAVLDQGVDLLEGALVEELLDALARGQLALLVLTLDLVLAAAEPVGGQPLLESLEHIPAHASPPRTLWPLPRRAAP